jgi:hypothetical protein
VSRLDRFQSQPTGAPPPSKPVPIFFHGEASMSDEAPRYRALGKLCLEPGWREIEPGAEFEHAGPATAGMRPLNAPARKVKLASIGPRWRETRPQQIHRLATSLGWSGGSTSAAEVFIEAFIKTETLKEPSS